MNEAFPESQIIFYKGAEEQCSRVCLRSSGGDMVSFPIHGSQYDSERDKIEAK